MPLVRKSMHHTVDLGSGLVTPGLHDYRRSLDAFCLPADMTMHPLNALAAAAPLCRGTLVISQHVPTSLGSRPAVLYVGGDDIGADHSTWWYPNLACFRQLLRKLGFPSVEVVGHNTGVSLPAGDYYDRPVLHAVR